MTTAGLIAIAALLVFLLHERIEKRRAEKRLERFLRSPRPPPKTKL